MPDDRRQALDLYAAALIDVALPLTRTRTAFAALMADPHTKALAAELRRDHPDLADRLRTACQQRHSQLMRENTDPIVKKRTTINHP